MIKLKGKPKPTMDYKIMARELISKKLISEYNKRKTFKYLSNKKKYYIRKEVYPFIDHIYRKGYFKIEDLELMLEVIMTMTPKCNDIFYTLSSIYVNKDLDELNDVFNESDRNLFSNAELKSEIDKLNMGSSEIQEKVAQLKDEIKAHEDYVESLNSYVKKLENKLEYIPLYIELINTINKAKEKGDTIVQKTFIHSILRKHLTAEDNEYLNFKNKEFGSYDKLSESFRIGFKNYCVREGITI
ncbi:MAG: hypothetical protein ACOYN6_01925 [Ignavibacteria bacterium]